MPEVSTTTERLDGWGEIAAHLRRDVTTAIRWEKTKGLPVHRVPGGRRQAVFAYRHEIDQWLRHANSVSNGAGEQQDTGEIETSDSTALHTAMSAAAPEKAEAPINSFSSRFCRSWRTVAAPTILVGALFVTAAALLEHSAHLSVANPTRVTRPQTHILSPLLSDGVHVFYPRYENGSFSVAAVPVGGGESTAVKTGITNPELNDLSADGEKMLLRGLIHSRDETEPLYVQLKDRPAQRVGTIMAYDAAWYPDGKHILFSINGNVYETDQKGTFSQLLFAVPGNAFWFRWARDGKRVRFTVIDKWNEATSIWEAAADGGAPHRIFSDVHFQVCCGSWTPDGAFYLFQVRVNDTFQIWAQRDRARFFLSALDRPFPLISGAVSYRGPLPSEDGRTLFVRAEAPKGELVRYDKSAGQFISVLPSISARTVAYSPDGKSIAYTSLADNQLWWCHADGTDCRQLTQNFKNTVMPRWSPDGMTIAFMGIGFTGEWGVFTVPADGGTIRTVADVNQAKGYPEWSPDGRRLVYSDVPPVSQAKGIYALDLRTNMVSTVPDSGGYFLPRWSPDGRWLIALHSGNEFLSVLDPRSGQWRTLAEVPASYPSWSHNSRHVYFRSSTVEGSGIFRVAVADGNVEKVANLGGVERGPFFLGDWIGMAPDDEPLAIRNSTIEDIYAWDLIPR